MKTYFNFVFLTVFIVIGVANVGAELIAYEGFGYATSPLANQDGGYGWEREWVKSYTGGVSDGGAIITVLPWDNLSMKNYTFSGDMGCIRIQGPGGSGGQAFGTRVLNSHIPLTVQGTYYFSWIVEVKANSYVYWDFGGLGARIYERVRVLYSNRTLELRMWDGSAFGAASAAPANSCPENHKRLIVLKLVVGESGADSSAFLKIYTPDDEINPTDNSVVWDAEVSGNLDQFFIDSIYIFGSNNANMLMDELRIGTEWSDVVPGKRGFVRSEPLPGPPIADPDLLAYEGFYYTGIKLGSANGGYGWQGPWYGWYEIIEGTGAVLIDPSPVDITANKSLDPNNIHFSPIGGAVVQAKNSKPAAPGHDDDDFAYRYLSPESQIDIDQEGVFYMSFLLRKEDTTEGSSERYVAVKLQTSGMQDIYDQFVFEVTSLRAFGLRVRDSATNDFVTASSNPYECERLTDYFVIKVTTMDSSEQSNYDQMFLKVYAQSDTVDITEPANWTLSTPPLANATGKLDTFNFYGGRQAVTLLDEIRIGKTWASVVTPQQICIEQIDGDINFDCSVDLLDFAILAENWLTD